MLVQASQWIAKIRRFNSAVSFVGNNEIITASCIQRFSIVMTMNKLSMNNVLIAKTKEEPSQGNQVFSLLKS